MLHLNPVLSKIIKIVLCNWNKAETNDILEENLKQKLEILSWQKNPTYILFVKFCF